MKINYVTGHRLKFIKQIEQGELFIGKTPLKNGDVYMKMDNDKESNMHRMVNLSTGELRTQRFTDDMSFETVIGELTIFE